MCTMEKVEYWQTDSKALLGLISHYSYNSDEQVGGLLAHVYIRRGSYCSHSDVGVGIGVGGGVKL